MPANMLPIYIVSSLASALISSINGRKQRKLAEQTAAQQIAAQQNNLMMQLEHQRLLHEKGYQQQIANQLRAYRNTYEWPLKSSPEDIAERITQFDHLPLFLVFAPMGKNGIQKDLGNMWTDIKSFFIETYKLDSETPVLFGDYKDNWKAEPGSDYAIIWNGLKDTPTLYIAPYSTDRDAVLGFTIAFWGINSNAPQVRNFVLDARKLYIDEIRKETEGFEKKCNDRILKRTDNSALDKNIDIFAEEKERLASGATFDDLDKTANFYRDVKPTVNVYQAIENQINPIIKVLASSITDMYFILEYGTKPLFPRIVQNINRNYKIPDLLTRGMLDDVPRFQPLSGKKFLKDTYIDYSRFAAQHMEPLTGVKYIETFKNALPETDNVFEKTLAERCIPSDLEPENYSNDQRLFLRKISTINGVKESEYFSKLIANVSALPEFGTKEIDDEYSLAKKYIAEKRYAEAVPLLKEVATTNPEAMYNLGICYLNGFGCAKDKNNAIHCLKIAGEQGVSKAFVSLFFQLETSSPKQALEYLLCAANRQDRDACFVASQYFLDKGDTEHAFKYGEIGAQNGDHRCISIINKLKKGNETMFKSNKYEKKGENNGPSRSVFDELFDKILSPFIRPVKEIKIDRLTFASVVSRATVLSENYPEVTNCKCYVVFDKEQKFYRIALFPVDAQMQTLGGEDIVMETIIALSLDDKLNSLLQAHSSGKFLIPIKK